MVVEHVIRMYWTLWGHNDWLVNNVITFSEIGLCGMEDTECVMKAMTFSVNICVPKPFIDCPQYGQAYTGWVSICLLMKPEDLLLYTNTYTECPRRNVPDFGRVFLMLKYTDITQNTYVQSWTVTEIMAREKSGLLAVPRTVSVKLTRSRTLRMPLRVECNAIQYCWIFMCHVKCLEP
jgi:hypothetical protein